MSLLVKSFQKVSGKTTYKDTSVSFKNHEGAFIDKNYANDAHFKNINSEGYNFSKVRVRSYRYLTIGDKLSSRHGQKGSIGFIYEQQDMPFTKDGVVPDIIINPHAIPSRMTIGQLLECSLCKTCVLEGSFGDATAFNGVSVENVADVLENKFKWKDMVTKFYTIVEQENKCSQIFS